MKKIIFFILLAAACRRHESGFELRAPVPDFSAALEQTAGVALQPGHKLELLDNGTVFDALVADIGKAQLSDSLVVIGSVNLEPLSLNKLEEGALVARDEGIARQMAKDFEEDCARSKEQK